MTAHHNYFEKKNIEFDPKMQKFLQISFLFWAHGPTQHPISPSISPSGPTISPSVHPTSSPLHGIHLVIPTWQNYQIKMEPVIQFFYGEISYKELKSYLTFLNQNNSTVVETMIILSLMKYIEECHMELGPAISSVIQKCSQCSESCNLIFFCFLVFLIR